MDHIYEYYGNIHMHTTHSDGVATFDELVEAAAGVGLDYVYVTDHNVLVRDQEEGYRNGVLTLVGQEVHDEDRDPPGSHLLCLGVQEDLTHLAKDPQALIDGVRAQGGLPFLAHPIEEYTDLIPDHYDWLDWDVTGYVGVELWNYMSRFRGYATSKWRALLLGFFPHYFTTGPLTAMLAKWDALTLERPVVALGGTDVHGKVYRLGIIRRRFLPYDHCARALNTHILTREPFQGPGGAPRLPWSDPRVAHDRALVLEALASGHCWIGYDLVAPTRGFRFWAEQEGGKQAIMGDTLQATDGAVTFHVTVPDTGEIRLIRNGRVVSVSQGRELRRLELEPGVYRVEVWKERWGAPRGWIFSNPIYVR